MTQHLTKAPGGHPGKWGNDWGTGYFPVGNKAVVGGGIVAIVGGGACVVREYVCVCCGRACACIERAIEFAKVCCCGRGEGRQSGIASCV